LSRREEEESWILLLVSKAANREKNMSASILYLMLGALFLIQDRRHAWFSSALSSHVVMTLEGKHICIDDKSNLIIVSCLISHSLNRPFDQRRSLNLELCVTPCTNRQRPLSSQDWICRLQLDYLLEKISTTG
jgi:hypothetical protein